MGEADIRAQLRGWILDRAGAQDRTDFDDETPILEEGLLGSLDVVELILFIESLRGDEVDISALEPEAFSSVTTVFQTFFAGQTA